ncbi:MAG: pyridoxal phosphate-dependent aminotransferase [Candidatus Omnitrophota bacterium]
MLLSKRVAQIPASMTLSISSKAKKMAASGIDVVNLGAGEPDFDTPLPIKKAAIRAIESGQTKYTPASGTLHLKEAVASKLKNDNSLSYDTSDIVISCGAKHSIFNILQALCTEDDDVLIPSPYWLSYPEMVKLAGANPVFIATKRTNKFKMTESGLRSAITKKSKVLILNSPSNPTGAVYREEELRWIADICVQAGIIVLSDEIYEKLIYDGKKHVSIASLGDAIFDRTIVVNGVSKAYSMTGWRIGYAAGSRSIMEGISNFQSHSTSNPCSISQAAALSALADRDNQPFVEMMKKEFALRRDFILSRIESIKGLSCVKPEGAFYVLCDISNVGLDSVAFSEHLLEEARVAVVPGIAFGADSFVRVSFAASKEKIASGMDRIEGWIKSERKGVIT